MRSASRIQRRVRKTGYGPNLLTANQASLETDTTGWLAVDNCTIARTTTTAALGTASLQVTTVAAGFATARTPTGVSGIPVVVGRIYTAINTCKEAVGNTRTAKVGIAWYNSGGGLIIETESVGVAINAASFTDSVLTIAAPAGAAFAQPYDVISSAGGTAAGEVFYFDKHGFYADSYSVYR